MQVFDKAGRMLRVLDVIKAEPRDDSSAGRDL
jgi:hypothetical protein